MRVGSLYVEVLLYIEKGTAEQTLKLNPDTNYRTFSKQEFFLPLIDDTVSPRRMHYIFLSISRYSLGEVTSSHCNNISHLNHIIQLSEVCSCH